MPTGEDRAAIAPSNDKLYRVRVWVDRRSATWRGRALLGAGVILAYVAIYHLLWQYSLDQWFLPVGLRAVWLLFAPPRLWPYFFAGDVAALLVLRVPRAETYGWYWALLSPLLLAPLMALVVAPIRFKLKDKLIDPSYLVPVLVVVTGWSAIYPFAVNELLEGPKSTMAEFYASVPLMWLGNYLGVVTMVAACRVALCGLNGSSLRPSYWRDFFLVLMLTPLLYVMSNLLSSMEAGDLIAIPLAVLAVPALVMTFRHGLNGAAAGIISTAAATAISRKYEGIPGHIDIYALPIDQSIAVFVSLLLVLGSALTKKVNSLRSLGVSERKALELAQSSFSWAEQNLRERLFFMAQMQMRIDDYRKGLVKRLRESGYPEAAMELNAAAVDHLDWFDQHAAALYPERIDTDGLFAALHDQAFGDFWASGGEICLYLRGKPKQLSVPLQLAAYRCICNALVLLTHHDRSSFVIRARTWTSPTRRGVAIVILSADPNSTQSSVMSTLAEHELDGRTRAFGGRYRRQGDTRLSITLTETAQSNAAQFSDVASVED